MTVKELVELEINKRGVKIVSLAESSGVSVYIIRSILDGKKVSHWQEKKVANYLGYEFKIQLIRINQDNKKA